MAIITLPLPNIFSNGTTADATQVNANLNQITANVNANAADAVVLATASGAALIGAAAATNNAGATVQAQLTSIGSATGAANVGFTPAGTGSVATTTAAGINARLPSVFDFMTLAQIADVQARTRLLDVSTPLQNALNTGRLYFMPEGDYLISVALTKTSNWGGLVGAGIGTRIITNHGTADVFTLGDGISQYSGMNFRDFRIWSTVTKSAGYCFNCKMIARSFFENVHAGSLDDYTSDGNTLRIFDGYYFDRFSVCDIIGGEVIYSDAGIKCRGNSDQSFGAELTLTGGLYVSGGSGVNTKAVWCGGGAGGIYLDRVSISLCGGYGLYVDDTLQAGIPNREIALGAACTIDTCSNWGIYLASDSVSLLELEGTWVAGCGTVATSTGGMNSQPSTGVVPEIKLNGCQIYNNYYDGLQLNKCSLLMTGCIVRNNGTGAPGGHGLLIADVNDKPVIVSGCFIHNNGNITRGYGISITSGSQDVFSIQGNNFTTNGQGALQDPAANTTTAIVRNNQGYVSENSGTATITTGNSSIVVNHGLATTPSFVQANFASAPDAGLQFYVAPADYTTTQFTIRVTAAVASNRSFVWRAVLGTQ